MGYFLQIFTGNFYLSRNYPNPFNPSTTIRYEIANDGQISLIVYDVMGRKVKTLTNGYASAGQYSVVWDGRDDSGMQVSSGVYFYVIKTPANIAIRKMNLIR